MYAPGGIAYVYLCYGIHHLFNVVSSEAGTPHAVLVRAGRPVSGIARMLQRRAKDHIDKTLLAGPGSLARALGITTADSGTDLGGDRIWIEDRGVSVPGDAIATGPRVGIDYAGSDALRPYRFRASVTVPESLNQQAAKHSNDS
jgi:DNA-3-methyladenine glycosylase